MKLYDYASCPFCQKVRIVLAEKDLEYEIVPVDLQAGEQRSAEFVKLNPYAKVPVLVDDETVVYDSTVINEYLEDEYPHPRLLPEDSAGRARVRLLEDYCDNSFLPSADFVMAQLARPEEERDEERLKRYQLEVQRGLVRLETTLGGHEFLTGADLSLADIAFVPRVLMLSRMGIQVHPKLRGVIAWIKRLRQRPTIHALGIE